MQFGDFTKLQANRRPFLTKADHIRDAPTSAHETGDEQNNH